MEQIKYAQEEIKKSRRKRDRIFWLWYLLPILFWGGERLIYVWVAIDERVMKPPEDTLGVPFPVFTILGMLVWAVFSMIVLAATIVVVSLTAYKQRKIEKQQTEILRSLGEKPEEISFRMEWLLMLLPAVVAALLPMYQKEVYFGTIAECIVIGIIFRILKTVQLLRQKR